MTPVTNQRSKAPALRIAVLVVSAYVVTRLGSRRLVTGTWAIDTETLAHLLIVPIVQLLVLGIVGRLVRGRLW